MPVTGLPKSLEALLITCIEEFDLHKWHISNTNFGCMIKINFNSGDHCSTAKPQIKTTSYKKKSPAQERRDNKRMDTFKIKKSEYHIVTRSKDKLPESARKDSESDDKQLDISPVSVQSAVSMDVNCSQVMQDNHSDVTFRSVNDSFSPLKQAINIESSDCDCQDEPLTFGVHSDHLDSPNISPSETDYDNENDEFETVVDSEDKSYLNSQPASDVDSEPSSNLLDNSNHANAECVVETKPYGNCLTINCDLAKLHPSPFSTPILDHGVYKCVKCDVTVADTHY